MSSDIYILPLLYFSWCILRSSQKVLHVGIQFVHWDGMCFPLSLFSEFLLSPQLYYSCHCSIKPLILTAGSHLFTLCVTLAVYLFLLASLFT